MSDQPAYRPATAGDSRFIAEMIDISSDGVALRPEYRGRGIGTGLMQIARQQAREHGHDRLSLVVFEQNTAAVRLYRRLGYETIKRAPTIPHPLIRASGDALLMVAPVS
jgi:ribosomal protein S18 acetylase RimI-like enzyme